MTQWYFGHDGERLGPFDEDKARAHAKANPGDTCWREGFDGWKPIASVAELAGAVSTVPPTPPGSGGDDDVEYRIVGTDMQFVEVELDPGESAIAEAGTMMYKDACIHMDTLFGDGSNKDKGGGIMGKLMSAGKRMVTGESLFTTVFGHTGASGKAHVAFAAPFPGTVMPMKLSEHGGRLICQKDSFLAGARGVSLGIHLQRKILTGLFGGEGFIMQKLEGDGWVFVHAGGTVIERDLAEGERLDVDTGCVVAFHDSVNMDIERVGGIKSMVFGGEGVFVATLTGPGKVWLQSLPFSRMAGRMLAAAPGGGGNNKGEGSLLGSIGDIAMGDN